MLQLFFKLLLWKAVDDNLYVRNIFNVNLNPTDLKTANNNFIFVQYVKR